MFPSPTTAPDGFVAADAAGKTGTIDPTRRVRADTAHCKPVLRCSSWVVQ